MLNRTLRRWLVPALALVTVLAALPAHAGWSYDYLKWKRWTNYAAPYGFGGHFFVADTTWLPGAASCVDTTSAWNMMDAEPSTFSGISIGGATADSSQVGALVLVGDSTVASTFAWGATTCQFQVNYGVNSAGWTSVGSTISPLGTTTQKALVFPMWQLPVATAHLGSTNFNATYNIFAPAVRAIITWGSGAACPMARCYVRKWIGTGMVQIPKQYQQVNP